MKALIFDSMRRSRFFIILFSLILGIGFEIACNRSGSAPEVRTAQLYIYTFNGNSVYGFQVNPKSGLLSKNPSSPYNFSFAPQGLIADSLRNLAWVYNANQIQQVSVNSSSGDLTPMGSVVTLQGSVVGTVNTKNQLIYALNTSVPYFGYTFYAYSYSLNQVYGPSISLADANPAGTCILDPTFSYIYCNEAIGGAPIFQLSSAGAPTSATGYVHGGVGATTQYLSVDNTGTYFFNLNPGDPSYYMGTLNHTNNTLGSAALGSLPQGPSVMDSINHFFFFFDGVSNLQTFLMVNHGATLTALAATGLSGNPQLLATDPSGHFVYFTDSVANGLYAYSINQTTGAATLIQSPFGGATSTVIAPVLVQFMK